MRRATFVLLCALGITPGALAQTVPRPPAHDVPPQGATEPGVLGAREFVRILGDDPITVTALLKPDTQHAALQVKSFKYVSLGNGLAVRFVITRGEVVTARQVRLQRPVLKDLRVRLRNGGVRHVPLVALDVCVGDTRMKVDFRLRKRDDYGPAMTLAAPQLAKLGARIDPQHNYTWAPACTAPPAARTAAAPPHPTPERKPLPGDASTAD